MPKLTDDLNQTWILNELEYETWEVSEGVTIDASVGGHGIYDNTTGSRIVVNGTTIAGPIGGNQYSGVIFAGNGSRVTIGESGYVDARLVQRGVATDNDGGKIVNYGLIEAIKFGISGQKGVEIENHGTVRAEFGFYQNDRGGNFSLVNSGSLVGTTCGVAGVGGNGSSVVNEAGGMITGGSSGVQFLGHVDGGFATVFNAGTITGAEFSIASAKAVLSVVNRGTLDGHVSLSAGADTFDTRGGTVDGEIRGNAASDTYIIDRSDVQIVENDGGGIYDLVIATVTFRLPEHVEALQILGRKNVNAFGNGGDNVLTGNRGSNTLNGGSGADQFYGIAGNDRLIGGAGADLFVFGEDYDRDTIRDFDDGIDRIWLIGVTNQQQFDELRIRQSGDDVTIDYGRGDRLTIQDSRKQDLTLDDLFLV